MSWLTLYVVLLFLLKIIEIEMSANFSDNMAVPINLKAKASVAAHDVVVAANDCLVCSGSQKVM